MLTLSKRKTFSINLKLQIDSIFDSLRKTKPNFLFCLLPTLMSTTTTTNQQHDNNNSTHQIADISLMRSQLKAYQLLAAARIYRQGYPEHINYEEFERRYSMFMSMTSETRPTSLNTTNTSLLNNSDMHKHACVQLLKALELDGSLWRLGSTQVFFKAGVLAKLEEQRDERVVTLVVKLQANARRILALKSFEKKRVPEFSTLFKLIFSYLWKNKLINYFLNKINFF